MKKPKFILTTICLLGLNSSSHRGSELKSSDVEANTSFPRSVRAVRGDTYRYYIEQRLREDLTSLFQLGQEITKGTQPSLGVENYRQVSQRANKIRKLASRIKSALTLGNQAQEDKSPKAPAPQTPSPEGLRREIEEIGNLVRKIRRCYARRGKHILNAKLQTELYIEIEALESLALHVKQSADELSQMN